MEMRKESTIKERRKKRVFTPIIYFVLECIFVWLVLSLIQVDFDMNSWSLWSKVVLGCFTLYFFMKMRNIYERQKSYPDN